MRDRPAETPAAAGRAAFTLKVQTRVSSRSAIRVMPGEVHSTPPTWKAEFQSVSKRRFVNRFAVFAIAVPSNALLKDLIVSSPAV